MKLQKLKLALLSLAMLVVFVPATAFAASFQSDACQGATQIAGGTCNAGTAGNTLSTVITNGVNLLSFVVGVVALIVIIIDGMKLAASNGDTSAVAGARSGIVMALVALAIVASAQVIVHFVIGKV